MDPPRAARDHARCHVLDDEQAAPRVDADHLVEHGDIGVLGRGDLAAETAAVHHTPQLEARHRGANLVLGGEIERDRVSSRLVGEPAQLRGVPPARVDLCALTDELAHGGRSDAATCTRHQHCASGQISHDVPIITHSMSPVSYCCVLVTGNDDSKPASRRAAARLRRRPRRLSQRRGRGMEPVGEALGSRLRFPPRYRARQADNRYRRRIDKHAKRCRCRGR